MSRIGKLPIKIPQSVQVLLKKNGSLLNLTGKFGSLEIKIPEQLQIVAWRKLDSETGKVINGFLNVSSKGQDSFDYRASRGETRTNKSLQGLYRTLINN
jgi:ribosomal protein L6P/L9E